MTPIDCRTCDYFIAETRRCGSLIWQCVNGERYRHTELVRLYVVTEPQEKPKPPRAET
jgi:hypothetical protein